MTLIKRRASAQPKDAIPPDLAPFWEKAGTLIAPITADDIGHEAHIDAVRDVTASKEDEDSVAVRSRRRSTTSRVDDLTVHYAQTRASEYETRIRERRHLVAARRLADQAEAARRSRIAADQASRCVVCGEHGDVRIHARRTERTCRPCEEALSLVEREQTAATVVNGQTRREHALAYLART